ncbi:transcriptional regulator PpsR [Bradyrhizobium guangzhouense]|uniref:Transcriptional regulator PpsR n=1 Tax=Bradyrhizobium guangzhouense TaxID=1325095 RepID=A0AAE6CBS4_9BRAD|nr:transcriptional regulator PpsR [Bradyrhizobium guangzhouense]QAU49947.1 transcriptional regulator PpsR [Bradyrhizobium guangzhouense]RXH09358.1 transcriptional regulator PpsR [Bradyrhizobium guangzhouense]RXH10057.1 transcriptional regulator PpsR [Bradyrhizobium guangzhouense]
MRVFRAPKESLGDLDADVAATLVAAASDIALAMDNDGMIHDVAFQRVDLPLELKYSDQWVGRSWQATVVAESQRKIEQLLEEAKARKHSRWREIRYPATRGPDIPILCSVVATGEQRFVAIGRDVRAAAALQQKLVEAQIAMERDYSRMRSVESRYRILFQMYSEPVLIVDAATHRVVEANPAASILVDDGPTQLIGKLFPDALLIDDPAASQSISLALRTQGRIEALKLHLDNGRDFSLDGAFFRQDLSSFFLLRFSPSAPTLASPSDQADETSHVLQFVEEAPDGLILTDCDGRLLRANAAFLQLAQIESEKLVQGENIDRWIGKSSVDLEILLANLRQHRALKLFSSVVRGEHGSPVNVEISAVALGPRDDPSLGFIIRNVERRIGTNSDPRSEIPRSREQLAELIGRVPLKELVRETTDVIERMCVEAALKLTGDNRATAAEMLGLSRQSLYVKLRRFGLAEASEYDEGKIE